jgi:hypothetical protein
VVIVVTKIQAQYATTNKELNKKASDKLWWVYIHKFCGQNTMSALKILDKPTMPAITQRREAVY